MSPFLQRSLAVAAVAWRVLHKPMFLLLGAIAGFLVPYTIVLNGRVRERFGDLVFSVPTRVYARPLRLAPGEPMNADALELELAFAGYTNDGQGRLPGTWNKNGGRYDIASRGYAGPDGGELPRRVELTLAHGQIATLRDLTAERPLRETHLDPARIATLYGAAQEERQVVRLDAVPPLLLTGLQAVEDRDFKYHHGIDVGAILRAALANLRAGHVVQGGSTLTQQLVRNLFLDRSQNLVRKLNEALLSVLIEANYSKSRILEAYVNEVFLGQQGAQAVHGFAAASQFYFGRPLQALRPQEIALLVGLVQGPSYYDPRRYPQRALARRNLALQEFFDTGLIDAAELKQAQAAPLGVTPRPQLPANRFPAFMDLVRAQLQNDFDEQALRGGGLSVFTTLDPAAQLYTERAIEETLEGMGKRGAALQAAAVVTDADSGSVLAVAGSRDPGDPGFNRALMARRPIGSLVKPFVYLVALAQPQRYSLASLLSDTPVSLRQPDGREWSPQNDDHEIHGDVPLVEALAQSMNLATVHLGLDIGVGRVKALLESLGLRDVNPNPSLLLGAIDLSPLQVAQIYQYLAAGGHALPLLAVRGVMDAQGRAIKRYEVKPGEGEYHQAVQLVTYAMQQVAVSGTASVLADSSLAWLHAAGKTGTSDSQRDSWFAGFTGDRLAVAWVGRDDNKTTGLWGATGGLRVWQRLFQRLPTRPLSTDPGPGLEFAWIDPKSGHRTDQVCPDARQLPFVAGYVPQDEEHCFWQELKSIFGGSGGEGAPPQPAAGQP
ncbi:penicillin-binding protein 1B [Mizugakiibacter sediminis]|uniref:Penicillin-binding protein 1B n=1 Tax=Mizugakiibacter sediminis TaxID=1475481 RepID=A0A0K8QP15_9GAMM|nr:penicillin-binding protein 1B [Mizugakiibacter sediminis]